MQRVMVLAMLLLVLQHTVVPLLLLPCSPCQSQLFGITLFISSQMVPPMGKIESAIWSCRQLFGQGKRSCTKKGGMAKTLTTR